MTERACAICVKRHAIPGRETGLGRLADVLECRARPPGLDVSGRAQFPQVKPDDYCHADFAEDANAAKVRRADLDEQARLDGLVEQTQARAEAPAAPSPEPDPALATAPAAEKPQRARRAREAAPDAPKLDL